MTKIATVSDAVSKTNQVAESANKTSQAAREQVGSGTLALSELQRVMKVIADARN